LKQYSLKSFTVRQELENEQAVPKFSYKQVDASNFVSTYGSFDLKTDLTMKYLDIVRRQNDTTLEPSVAEKETSNLHHKL